MTVEEQKKNFHRVGEILGWKGGPVEIPGKRTRIVDPLFTYGSPLFKSSILTCFRSSLQEPMCVVHGWRYLHGVTVGTGKWGPKCDHPGRKIKLRRWKIVQFKESPKGEQTSHGTATVNMAFLRFSCVFCTYFDGAAQVWFLSLTNTAAPCCTVKNSANLTKHR